MHAKSSCTWRTFGLALICLGVACIRAALAGPSLTYARTATMTSSRSEPASPGSPAIWKGVGPVRNAAVIHAALPPC